MSDSKVIQQSAIDTWNEDVDVIVVGGGAAGLCAAIAASDNGARVLILERGSGFNGTTTLAGGTLYLGAGTRVQKMNGFEDSAQDMYDYLIANTPEPDEEKIWLYCEQSPAHFDWLESNRVTM